jgi:hypothetical protein
VKGWGAISFSINLCPRTFFGEEGELARSNCGTAFQAITLADYFVVGEIIGSPGTGTRSPDGVRPLAAPVAGGGGNGFRVCAIFVPTNQHSTQ